MGKKTKLFTALSSIILVFVAIVYAVTSVISATSATATSSFTVQFTALSAKATVSIKYYQPSNVSGTDFVKSGTSSPELSLTSSITSGTMTASNATITVSNYYVLYAYTIHNDDSSNSLSITMSRTPANTDSNISVFYLKDGASITNASTLESKRQAVEDSGSTSVPATYTISASATSVIYMLVRVTSFSSNCSYNASGVSFTLARA